MNNPGSEVDDQVQIRARFRALSGMVESREAMVDAKFDGGWCVPRLDDAAWS